MVRVAHVIPGIAVQQGGPAFNAVALAHSIRLLGGQTKIFTTDVREAASSPVRTRLSHADLPPHAREVDIGAYPVSAPYRLRYSPALRRALRDEIQDFDVVHIHSLFLHPQLAAYVTARRKKVPYIVTLRGALDPALRSRNRFAKFLTEHVWQRRMLNAAHALHYTTEEEMTLVADRRYTARGVVIPNGVDVDSFAVPIDTTQFRRRFVGKRIVLYFGRLSHKKGLDILVDAFQVLVREVQDVQLVIAGPDDEGLRPSLSARAAAADLEHNVAFMDTLSGSDRIAALQAADVWVLPSAGENFATAAIEAMAAGTPVIVSPHVNLAAEIAKNDAGLVVERTPSALAAAIRRVLSSSEEQARLRSAGAKFAAAYDWAVIAPRMMELYREAAHA